VAIRNSKSNFCYHRNWQSNRYKRAYCENKTKNPPFSGRDRVQRNLFCSHGLCQQCVCVLLIPIAHTQRGANQQDARTRWGCPGGRGDDYVCMPVPFVGCCCLVPNVFPQLHISTTHLHTTSYVPHPISHIPYPSEHLDTDIPYRCVLVPTLSCTFIVISY